MSKIRGEFRRKGYGIIRLGTQRLSPERKKPAYGGLLGYILEEVWRDRTGWLQ
jgi:hypothetical protein